MLELFEIVNRFARNFVAGLVILGALLWVGVEALFNALVRNEPIALALLSVGTPLWSLRDYALDDQQVSVELAYKNRSELRLTDLVAEARLEDCPARTAVSCSLVQSQEIEMNLDTPSGMRGRTSATFIVSSMAKPEGKLKLTIIPKSATGQKDQ